MTWRQRAQACLDELIEAGKPFSSNDLYLKVGLPDASHEPNARNNSVGKLIAGASAAKRIVAVDVTKSIVPTRKSGMVRVWRKA